MMKQTYIGHLDSHVDADQRPSNGVQGEATNDLHRTNLNLTLQYEIRLTSTRVGRENVKL